MQDSFLLAYKGLINYTEPLRIVNSLVKINIEQYAHWRTFQWHWDTLGVLVDYLSETLSQFQVRINIVWLFHGLPRRKGSRKSLSPFLTELLKSF